MPKADKNDNIRQNWGRSYKVLPKLDLLAVQKESYKWFQEVAIGEILREVSPIDDFTEKNWSLSLDDYRFGKLSTTPQNALSKGITYDSPLYVKTTLTNKKTGKTQKQEVFLGDIPQMTDRGTFIINGIERAVVNQLVRSPGTFFTAIQD
ncbi:DNA-directed RNA polymerase subunit beta, partial [Patescibacteria group bacterium]